MPRTTRDADEAGEARTDDAAEAAEAESAAARPAKRKRRVRVIEVIDDEDLDEVLEALDADETEDAAESGDAAASEDVEEAPAEPPAKPAKEPPVEAEKKPKPRPARLEPPEEEADEDDEPVEAKAEPKPRRSAAASAVSVEPKYLGMSRTPLIVVVVLVALLASLAIWQWRSASSAGSEVDERAAITKVASAYGNVALNYNASNYEAQMEKAQKLMGGDLLETYKSSPPTLAGIFEKYPEAKLSSETRQAFVGSLNGRLASAVVMVDVSIKTKEEAIEQPATLLRLSMGKIDGEWKVTQQYASGVDDSNQGESQLPAGTQGTAPGGGEQPKAETSDKPKN